MPRPEHMMMPMPRGQVRCSLGIVGSALGVCSLWGGALVAVAMIAIPWSSLDIITSSRVQERTLGAKALDLLAPEMFLLLIR